MELHSLELDDLIIGDPFPEERVFLNEGVRGIVPLTRARA
jgi:hypothetical protein